MSKRSGSRSGRHGHLVQRTDSHLLTTGGV